MKSMKEKYENDPSYHGLVNFMEAQITKNNFTPSEMREMAVLACIHYEEHQVSFQDFVINREAEKHLIFLEKLRREEASKKDCLK